MSVKSLSDWEPIPQGEEQFPIDYIRTQEALILKNEGSKLTLGVTKKDALIQRQIQNHMPDKTLRFVLIDSREFSIFLANSFSVGEKGSEAANKEGMNLEKLEGDAPIINLVNSIIMEALKQAASDIHIEAFPREVMVRFRVDGVLRKVRTIPREHFNSLSSRIKIMANLNIMERRLPQDGRITVKTGDESVDLRISIVPIAGEGESIVLRLLNRSAGMVNLEDMGFEKEQLDILRHLIKHPHGLVLVTGPTGSGKTTTLNGLLREMRSVEKKIITIEDPIEYLIEGIDQIQTHPDIGLTFSSLLRRVLRQDPNIVMIGEIRDGETAELALRAALTGHLVLSTLHTNDAISAITRLKDMGVEPFLLAAVLKGALAQRLVRRLCPACKKPRPIESGEKNLWKALNLPIPTQLYEPVGCDLCGEIGFKGRTALGEIYQTDPILEELISSGEGTQNLTAHLKSQGMESLYHQGLKRVSDGETTLQEVEGAVYF